MRPQSKKAPPISFEALLGLFILLCFLLLNEDLFGFKGGEAVTSKAADILSEHLPPKGNTAKADVRETSLPPIISEITTGHIGDNIPCEDPVWCNIEMPIRSYFKFDPPTDINRWRKAQLQAARGEQVFLKRISEVFTHPFDFLDGDRQFRKLQWSVDVFVDERSWLSGLTSTGQIKARVEQPFAWEKEKRAVIPKPYDFSAAQRAPIVQIGYVVFRQDNNQFFAGNFEGGTFTTRQKFIQEWKNVREDIIAPAIISCALNENWWGHLLFK